MEKIQLLPILYIAILAFIGGAIVSYFFFGRPPAIPITVDGVRPFDEAIEMIDTYRSNPQVDTITKSGFISLPDLENYLLFIKSVARTKNVQLSGVQYYFSRYTQRTAIDTSHIGLNTLVFFPVVNETGTKRVLEIKGDIDVEEFLDNNPDGRQLILEAKENLNGTSITHPNSTAFNMSQMSPPRPPGGH